jgi:hypothetical protein
VVGGCAACGGVGDATSVCPIVLLLSDWLVVNGDQTATERVSSRGDAAAVIAGWAPRSLSSEAQAFVREVVAQAAPATPGRAKALLFAAGKLAAFGESVGLERSAGVLLDRSTIERFVLTGTGTVSAGRARARASEGAL